MGYSWDIMIIYDTTSQPGWMLVCGPENGGFSLIEHQFMAILMVKMNEHDDKPIVFQQTTDTHSWWRIHEFEMEELLRHFTKPTGTI